MVATAEDANTRVAEAGVKGMAQTTPAAVRKEATAGTERTARAQTQTAAAVRKGMLQRTAAAVRKGVTAVTGRAARAQSQGAAAVRKEATMGVADTITMVTPLTQS
jgi:hypothetical protein